MSENTFPKPGSDRWRVNAALRAYSEAKTLSTTDALKETERLATIPPPVTKGLEPGDMWWAGLIAIMGAAFAMGWIAAAVIRWLVG